MAIGKRSGMRYIPTINERSIAMILRHANRQLPSLRRRSAGYLRLPLPAALSDRLLLP